MSEEVMEMSEEDFRAHIQKYPAKKRNFLLHVFHGMSMQKSCEAADVSISESTLYKLWIGHHEDFAESVKIARDSSVFVAEQVLTAAAMKAEDNPRYFPYLQLLLRARKRDVYGDKTEVITQAALTQHVILGPPPEDE